MQRFVSIFSALRNHFAPPRSYRFARGIRTHRLLAMAVWTAVTKAT